MIAIYVQTNPFVLNVFSVCGVGILVAAAAVSGLLNVWLSHRPKVQRMVTALALAVVLAAGIAGASRTAAQRHATGYEPYCEGWFYYISGCFLLP